MDETNKYFLAMHGELILVWSVTNNKIILDNLVESYYQDTLEKQKVDKFCIQFQNAAQWLLISNYKFPADNISDFIDCLPSNKIRKWYKYV